MKRLARAGVPGPFVHHGAYRYAGGIDVVVIEAGQRASA